jgi:hypothetical protein
MPPAKADEPSIAANPQHANAPTNTPTNAPISTPTRGSTQAALLASLRKLSLGQALALRDVLDSYIADLQAGAK